MFYWLEIGFIVGKENTWAMTKFKTEDSVNSWSAVYLLLKRIEESWRKKQKKRKNFHSKKFWPYLISISSSIYWPISF